MTENNYKPLGEIIKETLIEKGFNQSALAKKLNVSRQVVNQIDKRKNFDYKFLKQLEEYTGIDFSIYLPIPDHLKPKSQAQEENIAMIPNHINEITENKSNQMPVLTYNFGIPVDAYSNIKSFQEKIVELAEKHGMIIL